ncbi:hypothetical protein [Actinoplanes xinjiangensis]|nr:hypothetical protein [Actinoplanes xinjiangensis]
MPVLVHNTPIGICPADGSTDHGKLGAFVMEKDLKAKGFVDIVDEVTFNASDGTEFRADFVARKPGQA